MNSFPKEITFKFKWRSYQERVLSSLDEHLQNRQLHLIAPPGSGKTVLGLEVMLRLNAPTLILAPTLAIKNQWLERFLELFLQQDEVPDWISTDIKNPKFLTITTYQSLHSVLSGNENQEDPDEENHEKDEESVASTANLEVLEAIKRAGFKTLILDEAHHLRTAWWKSTMKLRNSLTRPNIVALTATPPYDVSLAEWERYIELCGPIDLEISVPELVKEQDLCPHQDFVYFSFPTTEEREKIQSFRMNVNQTKDMLLKDNAFVSMLCEHPWIEKPDEHIEAILSSPSYFSSLLIFLNEAGKINWKDYQHILGINEKQIPMLDLKWLEELLTGCLFQDPYTQKHTDTVERIKKWLSRIGAIERRKVYLQSNKKIDNILLTSVSKLRSISEIVNFEASILKEDLRLVILTDYIRLADLPKNADDEKPLNRLGVIPIFETLRRRKIPGIKLGAASGSIVIIPKSAVPALESMADDEFRKNLRITPLGVDKEYVSIEIAGDDRQQLVRMITDLFSAGEIHVLTGTTALLGEGWDAPSINSIILASYVGTFMLSNQMRGRAIRVQRGNDEKTSTIWHLVCIDPSQNDAGYDMNTLSRRFKAFVGVSYSGNVIEIGMDRLQLEPPPYTEEKIKQMNERMMEFALKRSELKQQWKTAVEKNVKGEMVDQLKSTTNSVPRMAIFEKTISGLIIDGITLGLFTFLEFIGRISRKKDVSSYEELLHYVLIAMILASLVTLPKTIKGVWLWIQHGTMETSMKQLGEIVIRTLHHMKTIKTDLEMFEISAKQVAGYVFFGINGGTRFEHTLILGSIQEIIGPINNPRYIIQRRSKKGIFNQYDYHAVPQVIARNKESAEFFYRQWKKRIGNAELIFTRTLEGRKELLKARMKSLSSYFASKTERVSVWR